MNTHALRLRALSLSGAFFVCGVGFAQLTLSLTVGQPTCSGYTDGSIFANASGGTAPYTFLWNDGATGAGRYGLSGGAYAVTVTDASGATADASASLIDPGQMLLTATAQGDPCSSGAGDYLLLGSGGAAPYRYQVDGVSTGSVVTGLAPGYHYALVTDAKGCNASADIQVAAPLEVTVRTTDVVCHGYCDGTVEARIMGGTAPYTFQWSNGATEQIVYGLDPGTYTVVVTDANGCTATASGTLTEPAPITFMVDVDDPCANGSFATVTASGGTGNLTIRWSTGAIGARVYLEEGQHYVYIRDENGCEVSEAVLISDGIQSVITMNVDATCDSLGSSLLCITGGRGPFTYRWSDGQTGIMAVGLVPGVYSYIIVDGAGCRATGSTEIFGPDPATCLNCTAGAGSLSGGRTTEEACGGDIVLMANTANAPVVPAGYTTVYLLTKGSQLTVVQTSLTPSFTVREAGNYTIHTLVYDPSTFDISTIQLGITQASEVFLQIQQGGGAICASLDVTGAPFVVPQCPTTCLATAGTLGGGGTTAEACGDTIVLTASVVSAPNVPAGYIVAYILTGDPNQTILQIGSTPSFSITAAGSYRIHTLVYDPATLDLATIALGQTTAAQVLALIQQGGGAACASLDADGALFTVPTCSTPTGCTGGTAALLRGNDVCFDGESGTLAATVVTAANVPTGYLQAYLLVKLPEGVILAVGPNPGFVIDTTGRYEIRSLVYHPDSLDLASAITLGVTDVQALSSGLPECQNLAATGATFDVSTFDPAFPSGLADAPCAGDQITLNPGADTTFQYTWSPAAGLSDPNAPSPTTVVTATQTYQVTIERLINGVTCSALREYTVTVAASPTLAGVADITTCESTRVTLEAGAAAGDQLEWSDQADFSTILATTDTLSVISGAPTTYYLRATNAAGCTAEAQAIVSNDPVAIVADDDLTICRGDQASFGANATLGRPTVYTLLDSDGAIVATDSTGDFGLALEESESYLIVASNAAGCTDTADIAVQVSSVSTALFAGIAGDTAIYPGNEVNLTAVSNGGRTFEFDPGVSYITRADSSAVVLPTETTTYSVLTTDANGCTAVASLVITVLNFVCDRPFLFVPNVFTPDADNVNDIFFVDGVNVDETYYAIYNRWGQLVYEGTEIGNENGLGWNGTFNGQLVDPDVYGLYVRIRCNDGEEFYTEGNVTVIR